MNNKVFTPFLKHFSPADREHHTPNIYSPTPVICPDITGSRNIVRNIENIPNLTKKLRNQEFSWAAVRNPVWLSDMCPL